MDNREDFFSPDDVNEQIEQFLQEQVEPEEEQTAAPQVVQMLRSIHQVDPRIQHVRERLAERTLMTHGVTEIDSAHTVQPRRFIHMINHERRPRRTGWQYLGLIAACLVSVLIVGSLVIVLTYGRQKATTTVTHKAVVDAPKFTPQATATPTPISFSGKTVYTTPANQHGFNGVSWSPDSRRIATSTIDGTQVWDATTGNHQISVQLPGTNESPNAQDWSPNSQRIAVATDQHVLIVNGQTGQVELSYAGKATAQVDAHTHIAMKPSSVVAPLSSQIPMGGGLGFRATAWSPDGQQMASAVSFGTSGEIQVWNTQTGATLFVLTGDSSNNVGPVSWSSDGQYIASTMWDAQNTNYNQPGYQVVVWSAATHQIVFQHKDYLGSSEASIVWQPKSHNLAFEGRITTVGSTTTTSALEIWDGVTGKLVKQYVGVGGDALTWSPDGKYLAYGGYIQQSIAGKVGYPIGITDVTTDKQFNAYNEDHYAVSTIAWSPNGQYIASAEGLSQGNMVTNVWSVH